MMNAIHSEWGCQSINSFEKGAARYRMNFLYSLGKQPNDIYKPIFELAEDENSSFVNLDFSPLPVIPKFKRITNNRFAKIDFTIMAEAIDPYALDEKADYEAEERANIRVREMLDELELHSEVLNSGEVDQPKDDEELAIKMEFGYKHNQAIDIEKRIDAVFTHERINELLTQVRDFGFNTGVFAMKVSTDPITGKICIRPVDPSQLIISPTRDPYFRDIWYVGEMILLTIEQIRQTAANSGSPLSEEALQEIAAKNAGQNGNPRHFSNDSIGSASYDSCKIPVFDAEFLSCNSYWYEKRWSKNNARPVIGKVDKPKDRQDREYFKDDRTVVFRAKWIPGTQLIFDYGLKSDVPMKDGEWQAQLSYKIVAPELNQMESSPIIENLIPIADQICIAWYKLQNVIARARPKGIMIEIGALEDIALGGGGENAMRPMDVLDMFSQTGILVYRKIAFDGSASNYKPIEELNNGLGTEASEYFAVIDGYMQKMRDMIGFNDITDGTTPDPKTLNGVASMATESTNNALHHLFDAEQKLLEMVASDVAIRVHDSIAFKEESPYRFIMAPDAVKSIRENRDQIHRQFSIAIEYGSDKYEQERLEARIQKEMDMGRITMADAIAVERCRNTKQAEQILAYRIKKNQAEMSKQKQEEIMANAKAQAEAATVAEQEKRKTLEFEATIQLKLMEAQSKLKIDELVVAAMLEAENATPEHESKRSIAEIQAKATERAAEIKKQMGIEVASKKAEEAKSKASAAAKKKKK